MPETSVLYFAAAQGKCEHPLRGAWVFFDPILNGGFGQAGKEIVRQFRTGKTIETLAPIPTIEGAAFRTKIETEQAVKEIKGQEADKVPTAQRLVIQQVKTVQREFAGLKKGLTLGRAITRQEIKANQDNVIKAIEASKLPLEEKGKFIKTVKNVQTDLELSKQLPLIQDRIIQAVERVAKNKAKSKLLTTLKKTVAKKISGKPVGKFTPEIQGTLDVLRGATKLNATTAQTQLEANLSTEDIPSPMQALENRMLSIMADSTAVGAQGIEELADQIDSLITEGKQSAFIKEFNKAQRIFNLKEEVKEAIAAGKDLNLRDNTKFKERLATAWPKGT